MAETFPPFDAFSGNLLTHLQFFTSKRRTLDQLPGFPEASFARARHHIVRVGSVLLENTEEVTVWFTSHGDGKASWSSICMV
jgi:hypothetical protein